MANPLPTTQRAPSAPLPAYTLSVTLAPGHDVPTLRIAGHAEDLRELRDWLAGWVDSDAAPGGGMLVWDGRPRGTSTLGQLVAEVRSSATAGRLRLEMAGDVERAEVA